MSQEVCQHAVVAHPSRGPGTSPVKLPWRAAPSSRPKPDLALRGALALQAHNVETALSRRGMQGFSLCFNPENPPPNAETALADALEVLTAFLEGRCTPVTKIGDGVTD